VETRVRNAEGKGDSDQVSVDVIVLEVPVVEILSPLSATNYYTNQSVEFTAMISDVEDGFDQLISSWSSSADGELALDTTVDSSGRISDSVLLSQGEHTIQLTVEDTDGKVGTADVIIDVRGPNQPPLCEISAPVDEQLVFQVGDPIVFTGLALVIQSVPRTPMWDQI
jgi:hypothetical protein